MKVGRFAVACGSLAILLAGSGCSGAVAGPVVQRTPAAAGPSAGASAGPNWLPVDIPGLYSDPRTVIYDKARDCLWFLDRVPDEYQNDHAALFRINVADRSVIAEPFRLNADGYDSGMMALDANDRLWLAWGQVLTRFDPDTGAIKQWTRPAYSGLARVYSGDGRFVSMKIASDGEIWLAAGMLSAVFGFKPTSETWDRPINLPFVPEEAPSALAAPGPGLITVNGGALAGGAPDPSGADRFAVITTATRSVRITSLPITGYIAVGGGQIVYLTVTGPSPTQEGSLVRYDISKSTSTVIFTFKTAGASLPWIGNPGMTLDADGNVWLPFTTRGYPGVDRLDLSTGAVTQFPFPIAITYSRPVPTPPSGCFTPHSCFPLPCNFQLVFNCVATVVSLDPHVQGMTPDSHGNLWMVTVASSAGNPNLASTVDAPVVELEPSA